MDLGCGAIFLPNTSIHLLEDCVPLWLEATRRVQGARDLERITWHPRLDWADVEKLPYGMTPLEAFVFIKRLVS